ncbi:unnamed protein product [Ilex paraguariensis]|uniref:Uncharacterized protein n=1 Tax=Ilex paraguariensis TaxID=185542 RepID=A0ABC8RWS0_9AQUA
MQFSTASSNTVNAMDPDRNVGFIPQAVRIRLSKAFLSLFCILISLASGAYFHLLSNIGGLLTGLEFILTSACFTLTKPWEQWKRMAILIVTAFWGGASIGPLSNLSILTDTGIIVSASVAVALPYGCFSVASMLTSHSDYFYLGGMLSSYALIPIWLLFASVVFGGLTATWIFTVTN